MKKKKPKVTPAALLPNKKKEMLKIMNDPEKLKATMEFIRASSDLFDKSKTVKATTIIDWEARCIEILPDEIENRDCFIEAFKNFINNYGEQNNATTNE